MKRSLIMPFLSREGEQKCFASAAATMPGRTRRGERRAAPGRLKIAGRLRVDLKQRWIQGLPCTSSPLCSALDLGAG